MDNLTEITKRIFGNLTEPEREVYSIVIIEHIVLLYNEYAMDYEKNIFDKANHPELYLQGELSIEPNEYLQFIIDELEKDQLQIDADLLNKIIYLIRGDRDVDALSKK